jgi:hypothetical protein
MSDDYLVPKRKNKEIRAEALTAKNSIRLKNAAR